MESAFRASMNWLHTWTGVVLGGVLFAVFWMGSLSVFDREIDRWMMPMTRLPVVETSVPLDVLRPSLDAAASVGSPFWTVVPPNEREPMLRVVYRAGERNLTRYFDPETGVELPDPGTWAGTRFLYPFHYGLHIRFANLGIWLVGLAGMTMLTMCVSGLVIHRRILADFFTFRPHRKSRRVLLDLHSTVGVLGLPFHFMITLSGLTIFGATYFPSGWQAAYEDGAAYASEVFDLYSRHRSDKPGDSIASLNAMTAEAQRLWRGDPPRLLQVRHPGDAAAYVMIERSSEDDVTRIFDAAYFDAITGKLLHQISPAKPAKAVQGFLSGLHLIQFRHWTLRWLYFVMGLTGCVMIATGYLFWLDSRRKKHEQLGLAGVRVVEGLTIGSVTGIIIATLAFFVANRLLPLGVSFAGTERAALEIWTFYLFWLAAFAHAWIRPGRAWIWQCRTIAMLAAAAVLLNWITTGDHLARSLTHRYLWPVAGVDLLLIAGAAIAALSANKLKRRVIAPSRARSLARAAEHQTAVE